MANWNYYGKGIAVYDFSKEDEVKLKELGGKKNFNLGGRVGYIFGGKKEATLVAEFDKLGITKSQEGAQEAGTTVRVNFILPKLEVGDQIRLTYYPPGNEEISKLYLIDYMEKPWDFDMVEEAKPNSEAVRVKWAGDEWIIPFWGVEHKIEVVPKAANVGSGRRLQRGSVPLNALIKGIDQLKL